MEKERIQKLLSRAGHGSRREIERCLEAGEILVNGEVAGLGDRASLDDHIVLRGETVSLEALKRFHVRIIAYHKPVGEVVSRDDEHGRRSVFDRLPKMQTSRWISVGRLDINTSGLLLFTNDGELANKLMHPSSGIEREYAVRVLGKVEDESLKHLREGVELEDGMARFLDIHDSGGEGANHWYHVVIAEGKKREVRRLWESQGVTVSRLMRVRYGPLIMDKSLRPGKWRELSVAEARALYQEVDLPVPDSFHQFRQSRKKYDPAKKPRRPHRKS